MVNICPWFFKDDRSKNKRSGTKVPVLLVIKSESVSVFQSMVIWMTALKPPRYLAPEAAVTLNHNREWGTGTDILNRLSRWL